MNPLLLTAAAVLALALLTTFATAADYSPGLGVDEPLERQLTDALAEMTAAAAGDAADLPALLDKLAVARRVAHELQRKLASQSPPSASQPDQPLPTPAPVVVPKAATLALIDGASEAAVRALWREQLRMNLAAAHGLLLGRKLEVNEWLGWPGYAKRSNRLAPLVEALQEAERAARLLTLKLTPVHVSAGKLLFADDFSSAGKPGQARWLSFGDYKAVNDGEAFRFTDTSPAHPDAMIWTPGEFEGNFVAEFTFIPHSDGERPGALFTICGRPRPGKTLDVCVGESMHTYNYGIDGYHFSMHRGNTGRGNARRVGPGLKMLATGPDPCPVVGQAYQVKVARWENTVLLSVDGKLIHSYFDTATFGPVLSGGRIGLRHWAGMDASYKNFRVHRLNVAKTDR